MGQLQGRTAIVTGAGEGIGRAVARAFVAEGANVLVAEIDERLGAEAAAEFGDTCDFLPTDVGERADVEAMVAMPPSGGGQWTSWLTTPGAVAR